MIFEEYPYLEDDLVILRKMTLRDAPLLRAMEQDPDVYRYVPTYLPELQSESCEQFISEDCDRYFRERVEIILGIYLKEDPDTFVGMVELYNYEPELQKISTGGRIRREYWNRKIGSHILALQRDYVFRKLKLKVMSTHVMTVNTWSCAAMHDLGFIQTGASYYEDWGFDRPVLVNRYVLLPEATE